MVSDNKQDDSVNCFFFQLRCLRGQDPQGKTEDHHEPLRLRPATDTHHCFLDKTPDTDDKIPRLWQSLQKVACIFHNVYPKKNKMYQINIYKWIHIH